MYSVVIYGLHYIEANSLSGKIFTFHLLGLRGTSTKKFDDICYLLAGSPMLYTFVCDFESVYM
jgi:hypothetical protein